jgi:hypothetical protein
MLKLQVIILFLKIFIEFDIIINEKNEINTINCCSIDYHWTWYVNNDESKFL